MKRIQLARRVLALTVLACVCFAMRAEAASITIVPSAQDAVAGGNVTAHIDVSGLAAGESVGGVSLLLSYDSLILDGVSFVVDPENKMGAELDLSGGFGAGGASPLDLFFVADASMDHTALKAAQGAGFRVATVNFLALANGLSPLSLSAVPFFGVFLTDAAGNVIGTQATPGSVCVGGNCTAAVVPEPGTLALLGAGISALVARRRRRGASTTV
jgi:hypothetical protein